MAKDHPSFSPFFTPYLSGIDSGISIIDSITIIDIKIIIVGILFFFPIMLNFRQVWYARHWSLCCWNRHPREAVKEKHDQVTSFRKSYLLPLGRKFDKPLAEIEDCQQRQWCSREREMAE